MPYSVFVVPKRAGNRMATTEQDKRDILRYKMMRCQSQKMRCNALVTLPMSAAN
jgi:hypothetical protein